MLPIGYLTVILFLAALAAFMVMFMNPAWVAPAGIVGLILLAAAAGLLAMAIKKRNKTERI